eukprot:12487134-Alexandrium_andersonii.AAC.1
MATVQSGQALNELTEQPNEMGKRMDLPSRGPFQCPAVRCGHARMFTAFHPAGQNASVTALSRCISHHTPM